MTLVLYFVFIFGKRYTTCAVDTGFPSESKEGVGHIVGISKHCGHALTWKILTQDTNKVIYHSQVHPFSMHDPNLCADLLCGEDDPPSVCAPIIKSCHVPEDGETKQTTTPDSTSPAPVFNPEDLVGRTFLLDKQEDGQRFHARIVQLVEDHKSSVENNPACVKFVCSVNDNQAEEILTYNQLLDYIFSDENSDIVWKFQRIISHQGPLKLDHCDYKGSSYNVMIEWENGELLLSHFKSLLRMTRLLVQFMPKRTTSLIYQDGSASSHLLNIKRSSPNSLTRPSFVPSIQPLNISMDLKYHAAMHMQLDWMNKVKPLAGKMQ